MPTSGATEPSEDPKRARRLIGLVLAAAAAPLFLLILGIAFLVAPPPGGEPVASQEITSGQAFELTYTADGAAERVWLDLECEDCSLPVDGELTFVVGGREKKHIEISAGSEDDFATHASLEAQLLTDVPEAPEGAQVNVRGVLSVRPERSFLGANPKKDAKPPKVNLLRIAIAP